jgi:hypothetical protein
MCIFNCIGNASTEEAALYVLNKERNDKDSLFLDYRTAPL